MAAAPLLAAVCTLAPLAGPASAEGSGPSLPAATFDGSPETLLVSFHEIAGEWAEQDMTPLVRVYGDGTVKVHRPDGILGPGDYEARLGQEELQQLLVAAVEALDGYEAHAVENLKIEAEQSRALAAIAAGEEPIFHGVSDDSISVFTLELEGYRPAGATLYAGPVRRELSRLGLATDAERFGGIEPVQRLYRFELTLRALAVREDLERFYR